MCGIVGVYYFEPDRQVQSHDLKLMTDAMIHRGPDDEGFYVEGRVGLGMRRLSIIDIAGGHQPISTSDKKKTVVFNGEAYNYIEERKELEKQGYTFKTNSDTEVVLNLFDKYEEDCFKHINGMFGFAIWDSERNRLTLARDRIGIKPVYYYQDSEKLVFASEIKSILAFPSIPKELDRDVLPEYFKYGYTSPSDTLYKGIHKVPAGHYLQINNNQVSLHKYWSLSYADKLTQSEDDIIDGFYDLFKSAIDFRMRSDVPIGAFLSGGIDSSSIVHMMSQIDTEHKVNTYSIGFGDGYDQYNELKVAKQFADHYSTNHHEIIAKPDIANLLPELIQSLDEPLADSSLLMTYLVSKLAKESVTVVLSGVGGDELFGGYRRYLNLSLNKYFMKIPHFLRAGVANKLLSRLPEDRNNKLLNNFRLLKGYLKSCELGPCKQYESYTSILSDELVGNILLDGPTPKSTLFQTYYDECDSPELLDKLLHIDLKTSLPEQLLMLTDKMSMSTSIEARVPYLDHRVVEYVAKIPTKYKINGFKLRHIQKETFQRHLPGFVFQQKKKGFGAPMGSWFRNELKVYIDELLSREALVKQGIFNPDSIAKIVKQHQEMTVDYSDILLGLVTFQIWYQNNDFS